MMEQSFTDDKDMGYYWLRAYDAIPPIVWTKRHMIEDLRRACLGNDKDMWLYCKQFCKPDGEWLMTVGKLDVSHYGAHLCIASAVLLEMFDLLRDTKGCIALYCDKILNQSAAAVVDAVFHTGIPVFTQKPSF